MEYLENYFRGKSSLFILFVFCFFLYPIQTETKAQLVGKAAKEITLFVNPENPEPYGQVTAELNNNLIDLSRSGIVWNKNGKQIGKGTGLKKINITVGGPGVATTIEATITPPDGSVQTVQKIIRPGALDLLWEAETTTPPFYQGKALPGPESVVKLTAVPFFRSEGKAFAPSELYYKWYIGSKFMADYSGKGRSFFRVTSPKPGGKAEIKVIASSPGESLVAEKKVTLASFMPEVLFYEETPFTGPKLEKALPQVVILSEKEYSIWAGLYGFSQNGGLDYNWKQNGKNINLFGKSVTLAKKEAGLSNISLSVKSRDNMFQFGEKSLSIQQTQ